MDGNPGENASEPKALHITFLASALVV